MIRQQVIDEMLDGFKPDGSGIKVVGDTAFQDGILIGSSTWLLLHAKELPDYKGWKGIYAETPIINGFPNMTVYHAYKESMTDAEMVFHFYDHNAATSMNELKEAIDYWNAGGV